MQHHAPPMLRCVVYSKRNLSSKFSKVVLVAFRILSMSKCCRLRSSRSWSFNRVNRLGLIGGGGGAAGTPSEDEVEVESVGENAGDCGLLLSVDNFLQVFEYPVVTVVFWVQ